MAVPRKNALGPSCFHTSSTVSMSEFPIFALLWSTCRVRTTSNGVVRKPAMAPARPPAIAPIQACGTEAIAPLSCSFSRLCFSVSKRGSCIKEKGTSRRMVAPSPLYMACTPPRAHTERNAAMMSRSCLACKRILSCSAGTLTTQLVVSAIAAAKDAFKAKVLVGLFPPKISLFSAPNLTASYTTKNVADAGIVGRIAASRPRHNARTSLREVPVPAFRFRVPFMALVLSVSTGCKKTSLTTPARPPAKNAAPGLDLPSIGREPLFIIGRMTHNCACS
mmetsp:Transcript_74501/g.140478  ORF Transcript_74501/g.140478 Transcript_74501/m.140478 type:complete len:278 (-) Transcript_74501:62-895(-)